jgi:2-haloacid dehalogenase
MMQTRRTFLTAATAVAGAALLGSPSLAAETGRIEAIGFDAFTIFDARSLDNAAEAWFPGKGQEVAALWKIKLFDYCWLRTLNRRYADFRQVAEESLRFTLAAKGLEAKPQAIEAMVGAFSRLTLWPDSAQALTRMKEAGLRLAYLSNLTEEMLKASDEAAGIAPLFEYRLSTDRVQAYKPDPRAYAMAEQTFKLPRSRVLFAAFGGWDYSGAKSFGLETFWVNRFGVPRENLGVAPDGEGRLLSDLADYAIARAKKP